MPQACQAALPTWSAGPTGGRKHPLPRSRDRRAVQRAPWTPEHRDSSTSARARSSQLHHLPLHSSDHPGPLPGSRNGLTLARPTATSYSSASNTRTRRYSPPRAGKTGTSTSATPSASIPKAGPPPRSPAPAPPSWCWTSPRTAPSPPGWRPGAEKTTRPRTPTGVRGPLSCCCAPAGCGRAAGATRTRPLRGRSVGGPMLGACGDPRRHPVSENGQGCRVRAVRQEPAVLGDHGDAVRCRVPDGQLSAGRGREGEAGRVAAGSGPEQEPPPLSCPW